MDENRGGIPWALLGAVIFIGISAGRWIWKKKIQRQELAYSQTAKESLKLIREANGAYFAQTKKYFAGYINNVSPLVTQNFLNQETWEIFPYSYQGADHPTKPCIMAKAERQGSNRAPYKDWVFCLDWKGSIITQNETAACGSQCLAGLEIIKIDEPPKSQAAKPAAARAFCGNKICDPGENPSNCRDCCSKDLEVPCCGDGICEGQEHLSCKSDCPI